MSYTSTPRSYSYNVTRNRGPRRKVRYGAEPNVSIKRISGRRNARAAQHLRLLFHFLALSRHHFSSVTGTDQNPYATETTSCGPWPTRPRVSNALCSAKWVKALQRPHRVGPCHTMTDRCDRCTKHSPGHNISWMMRVVVDPAEGHKGRYQDWQRCRKSHCPRRRVLDRCGLRGYSEGMVTQQVKHDEDSEARRVRRVTRGERNPA